MLLLETELILIDFVAYQQQAYDNSLQVRQDQDIVGNFFEVFGVSKYYTRCLLYNHTVIQYTDVPSYSDILAIGTQS